MAGKIRASKPVVLVQGVPGLGLVGKIAVQYVIDLLSPPMVARMYSDYLPLPDGSAGVAVGEGDVDPPSYDFYLLSQDGARVDLVLLTAEAQPIPWGQYRIGEAVLDYVEGLGEVEAVLTFGGYVPADPATVGVFAASNDPDLMEILESHGVRRLDGGFVTGAAGLLIALAHLRGLRSACLLSTTRGHSPDPGAALRLVRLLSSLFGFDIDTSELEEAAKPSEIPRPPVGIVQGEGEEPKGEEGLPYHM